MQIHPSQHRVSGRPILGMFAAAVLSITTVACATADRQPDYRLDVLDQPVAVGAHSEFDVKLTNVSTGEPVTNARITRAELEMTMARFGHKPPPAGGGRTRMAGEVELTGTPAPGLYRFMGDLSMSGTWTLDLTPKVPGEPEPINARVLFEAER